MPRLSPDGTLLAYIKGDSSQSEVILRTYPEQAGQWQVSADGGAYPVWSPKGDVIYYRDIAGQIFVVDVRRSPEVSLGTPRLIPRTGSLRARFGFDVSPDGTRLLMVREVRTEDQAGPSLVVVLDWSAEFRK